MKRRSARGGRGDASVSFASVGLGLPPHLVQEALGVLLIALGVAWLITLLSASAASTRGPIALPALMLGWAGPLLPLGLAALGLALIVQGVTREPRLSWERPIGYLLLTLSAATMAQVVGTGHGGMIGARLAGLLASVPRPAIFVLALGLALVGLMVAFSISLRVLLLAVAPPLRLLWRVVAWAWLGILGLGDRYFEPRPRRVAEAGEEREIVVRTPAPPRTPPAMKPAPAAVEVSPPVPAEPVALATSEPQRVWQLPSIELLRGASAASISHSELQDKARVIESTLESFGVEARVVEISQGPAVTQFGLEPGTGVRVNRITALSDDLALALSARSIRIQAPVPGHRIVGLEIPNSATSLVTLRDLVDSGAFRQVRSKLRICLGQDVAGEPVVVDLARMPHLLIAGATGSGKSVCINTIIGGFLMQATPDELKLVLVDPKRVEMTGFRGLPHLQLPVVTETDKVLMALKWAEAEMMRRYEVFASRSARNIEAYNRMQTGPDRKPLPYVVIVVDELADLMMAAPVEVEKTICRLAQLARATGIHLVVATQRPSVDVITGLIKANFPARIAFAVSSHIDSRTILDMVGAEKLLGRGDMLYTASDSAKPIRVQGTFVSDGELEKLVDHWKLQQVFGFSPQAAEQEWQKLEETLENEPTEDDLLSEAATIVREAGRPSTSLLQRRLKVGYSRAARLMDELEQQRVVMRDADGRGWLLAEEEAEELVG